MYDLEELKKNIFKTEKVLNTLIEIISALKKSQNWELEKINSLREKGNEFYLFKSQLERYNDSVRLGLENNEVVLNKLNINILKSIDILSEEFGEKIKNLTAELLPQNPEGFQHEIAKLIKEKRPEISEFFSSYKADWDSVINKSFLQIINTPKSDEQKSLLIQSIWNLPKEKIKQLQSQFIEECPDKRLAYELTTIIEKMDDDCTIAIDAMLTKSQYTLKTTKSNIETNVINGKSEFYKRLLYGVLG